MFNIRILSIISLLIFCSTFAAEAEVMDFCVANASLPDSPAGYPCKKADEVVAEDFIYSLSARSDTSNIFGVGVTFAVSPDFAGVNGLGISMYRVDVAKGGVVPLHTHPGASELILVVDGTLLVGFVTSTTNKVYMKTVKKGDVMVIPQGLQHFQVNMGHNDALVYASFNSDRPGLQVTSQALFANNLPTEIISKTTKVSPVETHRLKVLFGGTN